MMHKNQLKMTKDLNMRFQTIEILEKCLRKISCHWICQQFVWLTHQKPVYEGKHKHGH